MTPAEILELTPSETATVEKQIAADVKMIRFAIKGNERARNLFFAYAAIAGARANHIMEITAHGQGEKILAKEFPLAERTLRRWREFATDVEANMIAKGATVALLTAPKASQKAPTAKDAEAVQQAVLEVMDGQGMIEFMRASKALKEPEPMGGDHGAGEGRKSPTAAEQREAADQAVNSWADNIKAWSVDTAAIPLCSRLTLQNLAEAALQLRKSIDATLEEKKSK